MAKKTIKTLIKDECANYYSTWSEGYNYCCSKDDFCVLFQDEPERCRYFEKHVLPTDPVLENAYKQAYEIDGLNTFAQCIKCGRNFIPNSNRQKYCPECKKLVQKQQTRDRVQKSRQM
jgi:hypothetical protein